MPGAAGLRGRGSIPNYVPIGRRWRSPFRRVETSTTPTPQHRRMGVPTLLQSWQEGYPHELEHRVEPALQGRVQSCRQSLGSEGNGQTGSDYLTAVTPSVTSSTMVLRRNIGHCYTDSVTIMAAIGRRARAPWACYTRTHATAPAPHVASRVFEAQA